MAITHSALPADFFMPATVFLDFEWWDRSDSCRHCPTWRSETAWDEVGCPVTREWHQLTCPVYTDWAEESDPPVARTI